MLAKRERKEVGAMPTAVRRGVARAQPAAAMAKSLIRRSPGLDFNFRWRTEMERVVAKLDGEEREKMAAAEAVIAAAQQGAATASPCSCWRRRRARRRWEMRPAKWKWEWGCWGSSPTLLKMARSAQEVSATRPLHDAAVG